MARLSASNQLRSLSAAGENMNASMRRPSKHTELGCRLKGVCPRQ